MENKTLYECVKNLEKDYVAFSSAIQKSLNEIKAAYIRLDAQFLGKKCLQKEPFLEMPNFDTGENVISNGNEFKVPNFEED